MFMVASLFGDYSEASSRMDGHCKGYLGGLSGWAEVGFGWRFGGVSWRTGWLDGQEQCLYYMSAARIYWILWRRGVAA